MNWKQLGIVCGALVALATLASYASPIIGDPIPLAGVARVDMVQTKLQNVIQNDANRIEARIVAVSIIGMWRSVCDANRARNRDLAQSYDAQLSALQLEYERLAGLQYPLRPCL